jgi:hypothetical protein
MRLDLRLIFIIQMFVRFWLNRECVLLSCCQLVDMQNIEAF